MHNLQYNALAFVFNVGIGGFSHPITLKLDKRNLPDDKVDDAEMEDLLLGIVIRHLLFFLLNLPHQFFSLTHNK